MNKFGMVAPLVLALAAGSADAANFYSLTVCVGNPEDGRGGIEPARGYGATYEVLAGKVTSDDTRVNTTGCQTVRYKAGKRIILNARTRQLTTGRNRASWQSGFTGGANSGRVNRPPGTVPSGPQVNACKGLGRDPACLVTMIKNRYVRANFQLTDPAQEYVFEDEEGTLPLCKMVGLANNGDEFVCRHKGYTLRIDRNAVFFDAPELLYVYYTGLNCSGGAWASGSHLELFRTRAHGLSQYVTIAVDWDESGEVWPEMWSSWARGFGCTSFASAVEGPPRGGEVINLGNNLWRIFPTMGGGSPDRGMSLDPGVWRR